MAGTSPVTFSKQLVTFSTTFLTRRSLWLAPRGPALRAYVLVRK